MRLIIILCLVIIFPCHAFAEPEKKIVDEVHQSANNNIAKIFVEDVISLLPEDFKKRLDSQTILSAVKFSNYYTKWQQYAVMSEGDLLNVYKVITANYVSNKIDDRQLSNEFGYTISFIVGVAMRHNKNDLLGDKFKANINSFLRDEYNKTHLIEFNGNDNCDIKTCVSRIYQLSEHSKSNIYPYMVSRTASLWTAVYNAKVNDGNRVVKTILRKPVNIALTGLSNTTGSKSSDNPQSSKTDNSHNDNNKSAANDQSSGGSTANDNGPAFIILIPVR